MKTSHEAAQSPKKPKESNPKPLKPLSCHSGQRLAFGYVRVSTEEQAAEGVSLSAQRERLEAWAVANGYQLAQVFADEGVSAKRADNRPALQKALEAVSKGKGVLVVYSLSRLARSTKDALAIAERLRKAGADLASLTEKIDTSTAMGEFFFTLLAALAQLERQQIGERTRHALGYKRKQGERVSGIAPFGFAFEGDRLVEHDQEQRTLGRIHALRSEGLSLRAVGKALEGEGMKPRSGGAWQPKVLASVCRR